MIKLNQNSIIEEASNLDKQNHDTNNNQTTATRPDVVDAKVYKLKSAFVKNSVFVTLSYVNHDGIISPIEIFINSKDLTRAPEYVVLTRLISAIFRRKADPTFILEELKGIFDPNGGSYKEGKYYHSFYGEIGEIIEEFFYDVNILERPKKHTLENSGIETNEEVVEMPTLSKEEGNEGNLQFKVCPDCNNRTLKNENGCDSCMDCGYSKCDK